LQRADNPAHLPKSVALRSCYTVQTNP
jgi:hypothetical protein